MQSDWQVLARDCRARLDQHPIYSALRTLPDLRVFMAHHVYSVWDFMSLIKYLQQAVAPAQWPWVPGRDPEVQRFINELVLEEESDEALPADGVTHTSHFRLYLSAMREIGADTGAVENFIAQVASGGLAAVLRGEGVPAPARRHLGTTFGFIVDDRPHCVAAALALGREHVIPGMFRAFLQGLGVAQSSAPSFHYYLRRHIHLDEDFHAPLSLRLLSALCGNDARKQQEAEAVAHRAVTARLEFWDGVLAALPSRQSATEAA